LNLRQLSYFVAIAEHRSFLKASQALHISQPSVSAQIKLLEVELKVQLLERRFDGTILTPEGRDFLVHAHTVLDAIIAARSSMKVHQSVEVGRVAVGIPGSLTPLLTVPLIVAVQRELPNVQLRVVSGLSGHLSRWLLDGVIDFGLIFANSQMAGLDVEKLLEENLFLAARDQAALDGHINDRSEFSAHKLTGLPLVLPCREHGLRTVIEDALNTVGVGLNVIAEVDAPEQLKEMVRRTGCYTILSLAAIQNDDPTNGALVTSRIVKPTIDRVVSIAHATGRPLSRAARRVEHILKTLLNEELAKGWWRTASPR
jgi:LysR family nitrogen assimilation transcriptional regulator